MISSSSDQLIIAFLFNDYVNNNEWVLLLLIKLVWILRVSFLPVKHVFQPHSQIKRFWGIKFGLGIHI